MSGVRAQLWTAEGWPVEHAVLTVTDPTGRQVLRQTTGERGSVVTDPLPPGVYTVVATAAGYEPMARTLRVAADGSGFLGDIVLTPAADAIELPPEGPWTIDPMHSSIVATAQHLGIASVKARFPDVSGRIDIRSPIERSTVYAEIKAASIDTGITMRDNHLCSPDFLDVDVHPVITFTSTGLRRRTTDSWTLTGELTLHGEKRGVELDLRYGGSGPDPWGGVRAAFHAETQLHRNDFAINYSAMVRAGIAVVGTTVKIELDVEAVQGESLPQF